MTLNDEDLARDALNALGNAGNLAALNRLTAVNTQAYRRAHEVVRKSELRIKVLLDYEKVLLDYEKEIDMLEDGYSYYFPKGNGAISAYILRKIADHLDNLNAEWDAQVKRDHEKWAADKKEDLSKCSTKL